MIRLFGFSVLTATVGLGLVWVFGLRDALVLTVADYRISTTTGMAATLAILFGALSVFVAQILWLLLTASGALGRWMNPRRTRRGNDALSRGFIAAAAGDAREARQHASKARALLGHRPLSLLLLAHVAQLDDDEDALGQAWHAMLARPDTTMVGLRGLFIQAMRRGDAQGATAIANRAYGLKPKARWVLDALFDLATRQRQWAEAKSLLAETRHAGFLDKNTAGRRETVLLAAEALEAEQSADHDAALSGALAALTLSPGFSPAAVLGARILTRSGRAWRAEDILAAAWTTNPIPAIALAFAAVRPDESWQGRARRLTDLASLNRDHFEGRMLLAEQAIARNNVAEARRLLAPFARGNATTRLCAAMAEIEQLDCQEAWAAHAWWAITKHARADAEWRCERCGVTSPEWKALCANCGAFDTLAWPSPPGHLVENSLDAPRTERFPIEAASSAHTDSYRLWNRNAFVARGAGPPRRRRAHSDDARFAPPQAPHDFGPGRSDFDPDPHGSEPYTGRENPVW